VAAISVVRFKEVTKRYDDRLILKDVFFRVAAGERVGLIGRNGSGKTTILRLILGRDEPCEGEVEIVPDLRIGYFSQFSELDTESSVWEVLLEVMAPIRAIEEQLKGIEQELHDPDLSPRAMEKLIDRQAHLLEEMDRHDGWTYENRIETVLSKLGFDEQHRQCPSHQLSGGWRNRAAMAKILLEEPDILLLDEPTNFLDLEGTAWLESWIQKFRGAVVLVSHDRHFLDRVVTRIVEVENYHLQEYEGSFSDYVREKQFRFKTLENQFQHEEELLTLESEAISDRRDAMKNPADHLKRKLANIKKSVAPRPVDQIVTGIYGQLRAPDLLLRISELSKRFGERTLFEDLSLSLMKRERVVVVGANGCGKSTLLRILTQDESADGGRVEWPGGSQCISFNNALEKLDPKDTVTHAVNVIGLAYHAPRKQVNRFLELMQFSEMDLNQKIGTLSGGQRARVALAQCLLSGAQVLILDEPTNHLDMTSTRVMEQALVHFPGGAIIVSHDRFFIDKVATRLLVFEGTPTLKIVNGGWTTWQAGVK
jgi:ATPase subunit of ABC transporter with duplicated ATPase domains